MAEEKQESQQSDDDAVKKKGDDPSAAAPGVNPKLVIGFLAFNALVGLGSAVAILKYTSQRSSQVSLEDIKAGEGHADANKADDHGKSEGDGHGGGKSDTKTNPADFFIKESFTVTLADSKGSHFAKVDIEIEVGDDFVKDEVNRLRPRIRDFINVVLSSKTYEQVESVDGRDFLREEIRNKINGYLTRGKIKNVYFTQFIVQ